MKFCFKTGRLDIEALERQGLHVYKRFFIDNKTEVVTNHRLDLNVQYMYVITTEDISDLMMSQYIVRNGVIVPYEGIPTRELYMYGSEMYLPGEVLQSNFSGNIHFELDNLEFFEDADHFWFTYNGYLGEALVMYGASYVPRFSVYENDTSIRFRCIKHLEENKREIMLLPSAKNIQEPLRSLLCECLESGTGMVFKTLNDDFWDAYSEESLERLTNQIERYHLDGLIEIPYTKKADIEACVKKDDTVITCYRGLAAKFNMI